VRLLWITAGLCCVGIGSIGVVVPGLPTTVFFVSAAWCFSRSSKRLERWLLGLPGVGPLVEDYRAGLGMPLRAKYLATVSITAAIAISSGLMIEPAPIRILVAIAGAFGVWYLWNRVPTKTGRSTSEDTTT
jgi:uncharacterized membrane protein YbaN (DUF454 family)